MRRLEALPSQEDKFFAAAKAQQQAESTATPAAEKPRRTWKQLGKRLVIELVLGYLVLCLALFFYQNHIVYMPQTEANLDPQDYGFAKPQALRISTQTKDQTTLNGWYVSSNRDAQKEDSLKKAPLVVLFFGGNAGNRSDRVNKFRQIANIGADVVCFDYRGYGDSPGSPGEDGLASDARAAWQFLISQGISPQKIVIHGESLGGGVAMRLASELCSENTPPAGLIVESTFTRLADVGARHYWFLPVSLILTQKYPSIERIPKVTCPLLVMHGGRDDVIPIQQGRELFSAARGASQSGIEKQFVELPDCSHNDVGIANSAEYRAALQSFLQRLAPDLKREGSSKKGPPPDRRARREARPEPKSPANAPEKSQ